MVDKIPRWGAGVNSPYSLTSVNSLRADTLLTFFFVDETCLFYKDSTHH